LLISECSHLSNEVNTNWPHINPQEAAQLAKMSGAKKLIITHFDSNRYRKIKQKEEARNICRTAFHNTDFAKDMLRLTLS